MANALLGPSPPWRWLASRDASISGLQASKADASALTAYALQLAVDTSSEVDSKIATALLDAVATAALDAALLGKADASALASLLSTVDGYVNMFEGPVTGNIPEVLDNGEVTDGTHVAAGQLALALTPYAQVTDLAVNTAASGNNAAAIQSLGDRVTAELASKLDSSALARPWQRRRPWPPRTDRCSIAALQSSLTTGLSNNADQSAFDVLDGVVATKSTGRRGPEAVQLQHHGGHERFHRLGQQRHAGHGGRQLRPQDGGGPALPRHSGEQRSPEGWPPSLQAETPPSPILRGGL